MTKVRMVIEAVEEAKEVMSKLNVLERRTITSVAHRFRGKEATEYEPQTWFGNNESESITTFQKLQNWVGSLRDNMMKVM